MLLQLRLCAALEQPEAIPTSTGTYVWHADSSALCPPRRPPACALAATCACWRCGASCAAVHPSPCAWATCLSPAMQASPGAACPALNGCSVAHLLMHSKAAVLAGSLRRLCVPLSAEGTAAQQVKLTVLAIRTSALPLGEPGAACRCSLLIGGTPVLPSLRMPREAAGSHHPVSAFINVVVCSCRPRRSDAGHAAPTAHRAPPHPAALPG